MELEENILASSKEKKSKQKPGLLLFIIYLVHICLWITFTFMFKLKYGLGIFFDNRTLSLFLATFLVGLFYTLIFKEQMSKKTLLIICLYAFILAISFMLVISNFPKPLINLFKILKSKPKVDFIAITCFLYGYIQFSFEIILQYLCLSIGNKLGIIFLKHNNKKLDYSN